MKMALIIATAALLLTGCVSYSEISHWDSPVAIDDGEVPLASFTTQNFSYQLLGLIPLCTGRPWASGEGDMKYEFDVRLFANEATLDNNLVSLKHALDLVGSHRITKLQTTESNDWVWSLFLVRRHTVRTNCIILKE